MRYGVALLLASALNLAVIIPFCTREKAPTQPTPQITAVELSLATHHESDAIQPPLPDPTPTPPDVQDTQVPLPPEAKGTLPTTPLAPIQPNPPHAQFTESADIPLPQPPKAARETAHVEAPPALKQAFRPTYPKGAQRRGEEGTVVLDITVSADGKVKDVVITLSSGYAQLDSHAQAAIRNVHFTPAQRDGHAVEGHITLPVMYRLTK